MMIEKPHCHECGGSVTHSWQKLCNKCWQKVDPTIKKTLRQTGLCDTCGKITKSTDEVECESCRRAKHREERRKCASYGCKTNAMFDSEYCFPCREAAKEREKADEKEQFLEDLPVRLEKIEAQIMELSIRFQRMESIFNRYMKVN